MATPIAPAIDPLKESLISNLKNLLVLVGGLLAAHGFVGPNSTITPDNWQFIVGAVVTLAPFVYSWFEKFLQAKTTKERDAAVIMAGINLVTRGAALATDGNLIPVMAGGAPPIPVTAATAPAIIANFAPLLSKGTSA